MSGKRWIDRLRVGWVLYRRDLLLALFSPSIYLCLSAACLLLAFFVVNYLNTVSQLSVLVSADPARIPLFFSVAFISLYLGVTSSISISSEREHRTLEVLFYGPVTPLARILSIFLRDLSVFLLAAVFFVLDILIASSFTNLALGPYSLSTIGASFFLVWPMVSFSLLLSSCFRRVRKAVLLFVTIFIGLAGLQIASSLLSAIPTESISLFLLYVKQAFLAVLRVSQWVSPFSYIARLNDTVLSGSTLHLGGYVLAAVGYSVLLLLLATAVLKRMDKSA